MENKVARPLFSIIIPAYNNAEYLDDAITSVLRQTYTNFELIAVNDASPDDSAAVIKAYADPRIKYIEHDVNKGLSAARNTGIRNAVGEYVVPLDGDDYFHPEKLKAHADFLEKNPDIGVTYNPRFELNHSSKTIREIWRPATSVDLQDLVFGYPFSPSDMVIRREWALRVNMFNEYYVYVGEDMDINCRLALTGCKFHSVDRALNYRRYHSNRIIKDIRYFVDNTFRAMKAAFDDPRCPPEVLALQDQAYASHLILWSVIAFSQKDTQLGKEYCREALRANPSFMRGHPNQLLNTLIYYSIVDESQNHEQLLREMIAQLPAELSGMTERTEWAVGRGYLLRFVRAMMWDRHEDGRAHFEKALASQAEIDKYFLQQLSSQLNSYEIEFGADAARSILQTLLPYLEKLTSRADIRWLKGNYSINSAFSNYRAGDFARVPEAVWHTVVNDPSYIWNRGVIKILLRSLAHRTS